MALKLAIWDMDGTLVDSREAIQTAMEHTFEAFNLSPPPYEATRKTVGLGLGEACAKLLPDGFNKERLPALVETYKQVFVQRREDERFVEPLYEGAWDLLTTLDKAGWVQAIATGRARRGIDAICGMHPGLADFFTTTWSADDGPGKPNPFMALEAMNAVGAETSETVMIGDSEHDIIMGRSAGVHTLGVSWGFGTHSELRSAGADSVHDDFSSLRVAINDFGN